MMVVSEIGEQWSPQTAPARQAEIPIVPSVEPTGKIAVTIGMRIPNVPHDVPVAKARRHAMMKITAGRSDVRLAEAPSTTAATNSRASRREVIFLRLVANVRIRIAGTIALKPAGIHSIASLNVITLLATT